MTDSQKPYMVYTKYGGLGSVAQNAAMEGNLQDYQAWTSVVFNCEIVSPAKGIDSL